MAQRRAEGLCYNCDENFVPGHRCKKLFVIEAVPDEEPDTGEAAALPTDDRDSPEISLHALTGVRPQGCTTMKIWAHVASHRLTALLDSGSTHNFIDADLVERLRLPLIHSARIRVAVANGDRVCSPGLLTNLEIAIDNVEYGERFLIDSYALPLGGYDMVLGVQ